MYKYKNNVFSSHKHNVQDSVEAWTPPREREMADQGIKVAGAHTLL